jgi:DNA-binding MarR family transcriptional regulator
MAAQPSIKGQDPAEDQVTADLEQLMGYNLKRAYVIMQADFRDALGQDGLAQRVFSALSLVVQFPQISQSRLARKLGVERSGLVAIIDDLEQLGYLLRATVPGDRRVQALVPTDAGRKAYGAAMATVRTHEDALLSELTAAEKQTLIGLLQKIRHRGETE